MKKFLIASVLVAAGAVAAVVLYAPMKSLPEQSLSMGTTTIMVEVASTPAEQEQGLSRRASLPQGRGMLFVFPQDSAYGFWMKDMKFSLDIIFLDAQRKISMIYHTIKPDSYPKVFYPTQPARYVLEVPAGFAAAHGIVEGMEVMLPSSPAR